MASAQSSPLHDLSGSSGYRMCTKHAACRDLQAPRLRLADVARDATVRRVDALCVCGEFVCLRSNVFILHIDSRFSNTQPHDETPTPGRAVLPYRVRADTTRMRRVLSARTGYIPTHRLSAAWKSSHTVKTHFPRRRRTVLDLAELMWSAGRYGCTRPRGPQRAALPDH